jgi:hypothetical protein
MSVSGGVRQRRAGSIIAQQAVRSSCFKNLGGSGSAAQRRARRDASNLQGCAVERSGCTEQVEQRQTVLVLSSTYCYDAARLGRTGVADEVGGPRSQ